MTTFKPTRGDRPVRFGPDVPKIPSIGPSVLDADVYRDPERYEQERRHILNRSWQVMCRSEQVREPGDFYVFEGHGESVVITRRPDGGLSGFHNVCQHRGARIVREQSGSGARRFTCPWHNWAYDIDGNVRGVPDRHDFDQDLLNGLCAPPLDLDEWGGWVWAVLAGPGVAGPLIDWIGPEVAADLSAYRMEDMRLKQVITYEVDVNWKVCVDAFSEYYHAQALHKMPAEDNKAGRQSTIGVYGRNSIMVVPFLGVLDELEKTLDHQGLCINNYMLFPTAVFNTHWAHTQLFRAVPLSVDRTRFEMWELWYDSDEQQYLNTVETLWEVFQYVVGQDVDEWIDVAAVKRSTAYRRSMLSDRECIITNFHRVCDEMLAKGED